MTEPPSTDRGRARGALPVPESRRRRWLIRGVALGANLVTVAYLSWRFGFTLNSSTLVATALSLGLIGLEIHNAIGLGLFTFSLWDVGPLPAPAAVDDTNRRLALLIPTYNEPIEVLMATVAAGVAISPEHETWVLDDGSRDEVRALAEQLGAHYLTRPDRSHAKAGNLNHALSHIDADLIGVVDADHVVAPDFFRNTLGYFDDPAIALVQTPQSFYNDDSFEHEEHRNGTFNEQTVFYRVILPAKNRWNAAFWCGTGAVLRVDALRSVGGVATETVTEDMHTTIRLHRAGWATLAHNEVLAHGLAASDAEQYLLQRHRWGAGAMQVLRMEKPIRSRGLSVPQKLSYSATLFAWFDSWRTLAYLLLPLAILATGEFPIDVSLAAFAPLFLTTLLVQFVALRLLARGHYPPLLSLVFEALRMAAVVPATLQLLRRDTPRFRVTPKGRTGDDRARAALPLMHRSLLLAASVAIVWMMATLAGWTPLHYGNVGAVLGSAGFLLVNTSLVAIAASRVRDPRFAGERRGSVRFAVEMPAVLDGRACQLVDLSVTGAMVRLDDEGDERRDASAPVLALPQLGVELRCSIRRIQTEDRGNLVGVQFADGQLLEQARLVKSLFHGSVADASSVDASPADTSAPGRRWARLSYDGV